MPTSKKPRRKAADTPRRHARTGPRRTSVRQAAPAPGSRRRNQRFGDGRPPRLPGRTGGR